MPRVSIVMPVFNGENYLEEAINSILDQTFQDFEFIIIEEYGNNETCKNLLEQYAAQDNRIKLIRNNTRLGIAESLNVGLNHSMGEYIARMDADDISGKERLKIQTLFMDIYKEIDICGIVPTILDALGWIVDYSTDPKIVKSDCMFSVPMRHPTIMIRKDTLLDSKISYDPLLKGAEDYDLFLRSSKTMLFTNIREPTLFYYRRSQENASSVNRERDNQIVHNIMKNHFLIDYEKNVLMYQNVLYFLIIFYFEFASLKLSYMICLL